MPMPNHVPTLVFPTVRPFREIHDELMATNPEYRAAWLAEHRKGDNLGYLHHDFMNDSAFYDAFETKHEYRKQCLIEHLSEWRDLSRVSTMTIANRMRVEAKTVHKIEKSPLTSSVNSVARYAHACGVKMSIEII